jgi:diguanylate cyclase (GGDEF)-like protein/PAS domain S-box-containing protein
MRRLHDVIGKVSGCRSLLQTLQAVVEGVVDVVGFGVAAVSYVHPDRTFEVLAVAGDSSAQTELLGQRQAADAYDEEFALGEPWGRLLFVPHERLPGGRGVGWVPDVELLDVPDAWHPQDALFAPLRSPAGELVGMLSVDLPQDRRRPGVVQREMLEMFAAQAGIAIDNARLSERLRTSEEAFRLAFQSAGIGMAVIRFSEPDAGRYLQVNPALCRIVGRSEQELLRLRFLDITHPDDRDRDVSAMRAAVAGGPRIYQAEKRYVRPDGSTVWAGVTASVVPDPDGGVHRAIVHIEDISDRRAAREDLAHRAGHDDLTGLPNRHTFRDRLTDALGSVNRSGPPGALLFCDIDRFKSVNDSHGHAAGDRVLIVIAQRLARTIRRGDTVARLSGDEFVVLAEAITPAKAQQLATRLRRAVAAPIVVDQVPIRLTLSIGIAHLNEHRDPDSVMRQADARMYQDKALAHKTRPADPSGGTGSSKS